MNEPGTSIFLTFDDGPTATITLPIAEVLAQHQALATFFVVGNKTISENSQFILSQLVAQGHLIANHTWAHQNSYRSEADFEAALIRATRQLKDYLPASQLVFSDPLAGFWNRERMQWVNLTGDGRLDQEFAWYVGPIHWNAGGQVAGEPGNRTNAADWQCWQQGVSIRECADGYVAKIRENHRQGRPSVVLMHDLRIQTRQLLAYVLQDLANDDVDWQFKRLDMASWPFAHPNG